MKLKENFKEYIYHPIYRFFIYGNIRYPIKTIKRKVRKLIFMYRVSKHYHAGWDMVNWVFWANGYAIIDFVDEGGFEYVFWDQDDIHREVYKKIVECYAYFKYQFHSSSKIADYYRHLWHENYEITWTPCEDMPGYSSMNHTTTKRGDMYWEILRILEENHTATEEEMIRKVIDVRNYLWS